MTFVLAADKFAVVSNLDGRALEAQAADGSVVMKELDLTNDNQLWQETDVGQQWINVGTGQRFFLETTRSWMPVSNDRIRDVRKSGKFLERSADGQDGDAVYIKNKRFSQNQNQKWTIQYV